MICFECKNAVSCAIFLEGQEITRKTVDDCCKVMGGWQPKRRKQ